MEIDRLIHENLSFILHEINFLKEEVAAENKVIRFDNLKKIISIKEAAAYLGLKISKIKRLINSGFFWVIIIERKIYIEIKAMEHYKRKYNSGSSYSNPSNMHQSPRLVENDEKLFEKMEQLTEEVKKLRAQIKENSLGNMFIAKVCKAVLMTKVAEILDCPVAKIRRLVKEKELESVMIGGKQYITIKSLIQIQTPK